MNYDNIFALKAQPKSVYHVLRNLPLKGRVTLGRLSNDFRKEVDAHFKTYQELAEKLLTEHAEKDEAGLPVEVEVEVDLPDGKKGTEKQTKLVSGEAFRADMTTLLSTEVEIKTRFQELLFEGVESIDQLEFDVLEKLGLLIPANYTA